MVEAEKMPGWLHELEGNHVPETLEYNISSFVFRAQRPLHPERMEQLLDAGLDCVIRAKGVVWVAGLDNCLVLNQAGTATPRLEMGAPWLHGSVHPSNWPADTPPEHKTARYGDRRQELVFIGQNLNKAKLVKRLEEALLTDVELEEMAEWIEPLMPEIGTSGDEDDSSSDSSSDDDSSSSSDDDSSSSSSDEDGSCRQSPTETTDLPHKHAGPAEIRKENGYPGDDKRLTPMAVQ